MSILSHISIITYLHLDHNLVFKGYYNGKTEICLVHGGRGKKGKDKGKPICKYPVTKNGKLNCGRVRNAASRAAQQGIKLSGLEPYRKRCHEHGRT